MASFGQSNFSIACKNIPWCNTFSWWLEMKLVEQRNTGTLHTANQNFRYRQIFKQWGNYHRWKKPAQCNQEIMVNCNSRQQWCQEHHSANTNFILKTMCGEWWVDDERAHRNHNFNILSTLHWSNIATLKLLHCSITEHSTMIVQAKRSTGNSSEMQHNL